MRYRSMEATRSGDLRSRTTAGSELESGRGGDLRRTTGSPRRTRRTGVRRPRRKRREAGSGDLAEQRGREAGSGDLAEQPGRDGGVRRLRRTTGGRRGQETLAERLRQPLVFIHGHPLELVERNSVESLTGYDSSGHRFPPFQDTTGSCEKNSLPLSSTRMKAGKSTTSIL